MSDPILPVVSYSYFCGHHFQVSWVGGLNAFPRVYILNVVSSHLLV